MDITLNYIDVGNGFPLILLHGNGESHEYFSNQTAFFKTKYRVIAIDTRGHGASPRGQTDFTLKQFSNDLQDFMTEHGINKANTRIFRRWEHCPVFCAQISAHG